MPEPGDVIIRRRSGTRIEFLETAASTANARLRLRLTAPRQTRWGEIRHIHPNQEEILTVRSGTLQVEIGRERHRLGPHETMTVTPGLPHRYWSTGDEELVLEAEFRPAGRTELMFEQMFGAENLALARVRSAPGFLQIFLWANAYEMYSAVPALSLQRMLSTVFSPLARLCGYRVIDDECSAAAQLRPEDCDATIESRTASDMLECDMPLRGRR